MLLKECRLSAGLTQYEAAAALGITRTTISMWETGDSMPRADMLPRISNLYHCEISDLYSKEEKKESSIHDTTRIDGDTG